MAGCLPVKHLCPRCPALHHAAEILAEQILFSSVIILTKIDTVPQSVVDAQVNALRTIQPYATVGLAAQGGLLLPQLDATPAPSMSDMENRATQFGLSEEATPVAWSF